MVARQQSMRHSTLPAPGVASASRPSLRLPGTVGIGQAVDAARDALCALLTMKTDPNDLGAWLSGPYREATRFATSLQSVERRPESASSILAAQRKSARVIDAASRGSESLVRELRPVIHIRPAHDLFGGRGFVPFDVAGASLVDKALALALADYFTRPEEFLAHEYATGAALLRRISGEMCAVGAADRK
jgi:hypothetical protein